LTGAALGALTNCVNGLVSPLYFCNILGWHDVSDVWRASIAQGIFEGLMFGLFLALVFTTVVGCVSKVRCSFGFGAAILAFVAVATLVCWAVGGLLGMGLATLSPDFSPRLYWCPAGLWRDAPLRLGRRVDLGHRVWRLRPDGSRFVPVPREVAAGTVEAGPQALFARRLGRGSVGRRETPLSRQDLIEPLFRHDPSAATRHATPARDGIIGRPGVVDSYLFVQSHR